MAQIKQVGAGRKTSGKVDGLEKEPYLGYASSPLAEIRSTQIPKSFQPNN